MDLTVTGRRSGQESTRTIWFVEERIACSCSFPSRALTATGTATRREAPDVRLAANGAELRATARPIDDATTVAEVVEQFREKYGADQVAEYYPKQNAAVEVPLD